jgi:hypothetical protein
MCRDKAIAIRKKFFQQQRQMKTLAKTVVLASVAEQNKGKQSCTINR